MSRTTALPNAKFKQCYALAKAVKRSKNKKAIVHKLMQTLIVAMSETNH
jgi:hypothetical protein